jgi:Domain of unknown function (DUF4398)
MTPILPKIYRVIVISGLLLAGCEPPRPPAVGLDDAARMLADARATGAPTYAPLEVRNAEDRLSQARASFDKKNYDDATRFVQESRVDSELATVKSRLGKAREKADQRARENAQLQQDAANGTSPSVNGEFK